MKRYLPMTPKKPKSSSDSRLGPLLEALMALSTLMALGPTKTRVRMWPLVSAIPAPSTGTLTAPLDMLKLDLWMVLLTSISFLSEVSTAESGESGRKTAAKKASLDAAQEMGPL